MTRQECEAIIEKNLIEIVKAYNQYNPNGKYLSLCYNGDEGVECIAGNNRCWSANEAEGREAGSDYLAGKIIDFYRDITEEN